ncbi:hypothetical protein A0257_10455 [Hymenobacter psoromatis]|nr:hypothetical protein A0257_10455 [Hymenobacter psoromatis]
MKFPLRPVVAVLLFGSAATLLTACSYEYSPGIDKQFMPGFSNPKGYTNADINRDSINNKETVTKPTGEGSATAIKKGSVNDKLNSAPAGNNTTSPQTASGQMGTIDQNMKPPKTPTSKKSSAM